jgi:hypothetical protein
MAPAAAFGLTDLSAFRALAADDKLPDARRIEFAADIEPIVRLIEETPRDQCVATLIGQLQKGLPYRRFLAAVFLSAVRKRDSHHSVYLVNSAHQVSLDLPPEDRLLPLFWAVDHYKWQQARFPTPPLEPLAGALPAPEKAAAEFHDAVQRADSPRAERALVALARSDGARQAAEQLWLYGCRDMSFIGHRAISVVSCWRVVETIGWPHAEPVLRFVVRDLFLRGGGPDRYFKPNAARADKLLDKLPPGWATGKPDRGATLELFSLMRQGKGEPACELASKQLAGGTGAQAIWDAVHVGASELLMLHLAGSGMSNRPLHINTAVNALHFAFNTSPIVRLRLFNLLQAVAWVADFISVDLGGKNLEDSKPLALEGAKLPETSSAAIDEIFAQLPPKPYAEGGAGYNFVKRADRVAPGKQVFALINKNPETATAYMQAARSWLCVKTTVEAHEYKLPAALFEDYELVSPEWRPRLLAASAHWLHGKQSPDSKLIEQAREALKKARL